MTVVVIMLYISDYGGKGGVVENTLIADIAVII